MPVRFGNCVFDPEARTLTRAGRRVELAPKAFDLLAALVEASPRALSQAELRDRLWPDAHVAYTSLARVVSELRRALGDGVSQRRLVRTVQRFGYALTETHHEADAAASAFSVVRGADEIRLREGENLIGRGSECVVRIDSDRVSRHHARVLVEGSQASLEDLGSKNGTFLNGKRLTGVVVLSIGNVIGIGPSVLVFRAPTGQGTTRSATAPSTPSSGS